MLKMLSIPGLLHLAAKKRQQVEWLRTKAANPAADPRDAHESEVSAAAMEEDAIGLESHATENTSLVLNIETLIHALLHSPFQSADRKLALRHLEDASMRLRRETGDLPES